MKFLNLLKTKNPKNERNVSEKNHENGWCRLNGGKTWYDMLEPTIFPRQVGVNGGLDLYCEPITDDHLVLVFSFRSWTLHFLVDQMECPLLSLCLFTQHLKSGRLPRVMLGSRDAELSIGVKKERSGNQLLVSFCHSDCGTTTLKQVSLPREVLVGRMTYMLQSIADDEALGPLYLRWFEFDDALEEEAYDLADQDVAEFLTNASSLPIDREVISNAALRRRFIEIRRLSPAHSARTEELRGMLRTLTIPKGWS